MRRIALLLALAAAGSMLGTAVALADMECGPIDQGNRHYARYWTGDGDTLCFLCPGPYRTGGSFAQCKPVSCPAEQYDQAPKRRN